MVVRTKSNSVRHLSIIGVKTEWLTPPKMLEEACKKYNVNPILDPCADNGKHLKLPFNYTKKQDGLKRNWIYDAFVNPPYGRELPPWVKKSYDEHKKHNITVLLLIFAKVGTSYWHDFIEDIAEVHNIRGRIRFIDGETGKVSKNSAPYDSSWVIWRRKT